jgi:hypothetical protein
LLGPRAQRAWQAAGSPDPYCPGNIVDNTTGYMGIDLIFHPRKNQSAKFFVACVYAPYGELESTNHPSIITKFYKTIETHLLQLPSDTTPIIGGDFNAYIGVCSNPDDACIIGPYGLPHSNSAGEKLIDRHTTAAYKQVLPTSNTTVTKHSMTSGMIMPPDSLILFSCISVMAHMLLMLAYSNHETTSYLTIMLPTLNSVLLDICLRARSHEYKVKRVICWLKTPFTGAFFIRTNSSDKNTQTKSKQSFSNMLTAILMKPRQHNYLKQLCMPLKAPSLKPKTARRTGLMPVNPSSNPSVTLPNVHIKTSLLMALMQTNNIGKPPAIITTKYSVRQRSNTLTKLP